MENNKEKENKLLTLFRDIVEKSEDSIFVLDTDLIYVYVNNKMSGNFNKSPKDIIGKRIDDLFSKEISLQLTANCNEIIDKGVSLSLEDKVTIPSGIQYISTVLNPIKDNDEKVVYIVGIARDISDRKIQENLVKEKLNELEKLNQMMIGRELKMVELKEENSDIKARCENKLLPAKGR